MIRLEEVRTYDDLLTAIAKMSPEQRAQAIQVAAPSCDCIVELMPSVSIGTVDAHEFERCRSSVDNKYHGDEVVLQIDWNPYREDGAIGFELDVVDGKRVDIYGKDGKTNPDDQLRPLPF